MGVRRGIWTLSGTEDVRARYGVVQQMANACGDDPFGFGATAGIRCVRMTLDGHCF